MKRTALMVAVLGLVVGTAQAGVMVEVTVTGELEFNQIGAPPLGDAVPGDPATLTFMLDSDNFMDSMNFPVRGYVIDMSSFTLTIGSAVVGLADPFPPGDTPYFCVRNNDPAVDGFWTSTLIDFPAGVPLDQAGIFGDFLNNFYVTYTGDTLDSLDILDALGTYTFDGLTVFNWTVDDGPFNAAGLIFEQMTIAAATVPAAVDLKPGSCPNSFNRGSHGRLPAAILGTETFDVTMIDPETVVLSRADGMGGSVSPVKFGYEDVGTPFEGELCDCHEMYGDGIMDLTLKFLTDEVVDILLLDMIDDGTVELVISGNFMDGTPFAGADCLRFVPVAMQAGGPSPMLSGGN